MPTQSRFQQVFRSKYCIYRPDIKMARTSRHATGAKNRVSKYDQSNIFQILRKLSPGSHIFLSGRIDQLAPPCTRIPLSSSCRRALRGTCSGRSGPGSSPRGRSRTRGLAPRAAANPGFSPRGRARARGLAPGPRARANRARLSVRGAPKARVYACAAALKARVGSSGARVKRGR